jgi:hypothetical protein
MIALPISVVVVVFAALLVLFLARQGFKQNRVARDVRPGPGATSKLAILALIVAFLVPPIGVVLAHIALFRIGTGAARGRLWADRALWVGYILLLVELVLFLAFYRGTVWF